MSRATDEVVAQQRKIQEAGIEYIMGYDTPAAQWVAKFVSSNELAAKDDPARALRGE